MTSPFSERNPFASGYQPKVVESGVARFAKPEKSDLRKEKWLRLGPNWTELRISDSRLKERGVVVSREDADRYHEKREGHRPMKVKDEDAMAELIMLEGSDQVGMAKSAHEMNKWFGEHVAAYPPHKIDDVLRGTDAILLFKDWEDERVAYPLAVDLTTSPEKVNDKIFWIMEMARKEPAEIYWVDTDAEESRAEFDEPTEGRIKVINAAVYMPTEFLSGFIDERLSSQEREKQMRMLGPLVVKQLQAQLEAQALAAIKPPFASRSLITEGSKPSFTRSEILAKLRKLSGGNVRAKILAGLLPTIWESSDGMGELTPNANKSLPQFTRSWQELSRHKKTAPQAGNVGP